MKQDNRKLYYCQIYKIDYLIHDEKLWVTLHPINKLDKKKTKNQG